MEERNSLVWAFACHLEAVQAANSSVQTVKLYDGRHKQFLTYLKQQGHSPPFAVELLNAANVRRASIWLRERSKGPRGGEAAARALVTTLKTTSAWLADEEFIEVDLLARVKRPRVTSVARTPFSQTEVRDLVNTAMDSELAARNIAIIHLLLDTGMRVGGLCSIMLEDVDLRDRRLEIRLKGGRRQTLYFGSAQRRDGGRTVRALKRYLTERESIMAGWLKHGRSDHGRLFVSRDGWPLQEDAVRSMFKRLEQTSGVANVIPHRFRHTYATWYLVRNQGDETGLRGILGHLSSDMYQVYAHIAHEIIAERAGRESLSDAWLDDNKDGGAGYGRNRTDAAVDRFSRRSSAM